MKNNNFNEWFNKISDDLGPFGKKSFYVNL